MTQCEAIKEYMKNCGSISQMEAARDIGCLRLSERIRELQAQGVKIRKMKECCSTRTGKKSWYTRYSLEGE